MGILEADAIPVVMDAAFGPGHQNTNHGPVSAPRFQRAALNRTRLSAMFSLSLASPAKIPRRPELHLPGDAFRNHIEPSALGSRHAAPRRRTGSEWSECARRRRGAGRERAGPA